MMNGNIYWREIDKQGNTVWLNNDAPNIRKLAEGEALTTSRKCPRIAASIIDENAEPNNQLQTMLN